ncbi:transporter [Duganella sp. FT80W]|uniref:Transporter n=1 Tax=Duganella guangzhouensis TaxID=2666084 RepID=A0A6I2L6G9_9BURK|nr:OmpP1/FadL family transporter [Duganella guangzhouensis]MRW92817.1 transporter [Duganella guangzhouensis]
MKLKKISLAVMTMWSVALSGAASASGYQFGSQTISGQGSAFSNAAEANDASVLFTNPAAMARLKGTELSAGLTLVVPHSSYTDLGSTNVLGKPTGGGNGGTFAPKLAGAPSFYLTHEINDRLAVGVGMFVPYGAKLDYGDNWVGRYSLQSIELKTVDINPSVSFKLNDRHSIGLGVSAQYMTAKMKQAGDVTTAAAEIGAQYGSSSAGISGDGQSRISGDDWAYGWNIGYMFQLDEATRFGLAYRSSIKQTLKGDWRWDFSKVTGSFTGGHLNGVSMRALAEEQEPSSKAAVSLATPETLSANLFHQLNPTIALMGDVTWTRNSRLQDLVISQSNGVGPATIHMNWRDTYRMSVGLNYQVKEGVMLRTGLGYDQSPISGGQARHPSLPDSARSLLSVGGSYRLNQNASIDWAYTYMHIKDALAGYTDTCNPALTTCSGNGETTTGAYKTYIQMVGIQYNHIF